MMQILEWIAWGVLFFCVTSVAGGGMVLLLARWFERGE